MIIRSRVVERLIIRENNEEKKMARMVMIKMIIWIVKGTIIRESGGENEKEMARMMIIRDQIIERPIICENNEEKKKWLGWWWLKIMERMKKKWPEWWLRW